jgi:hypothetical protein
MLLLVVVVVVDVICYLGQYWMIDYLIGWERGKREAFCNLVHDLTSGSGFAVAVVCRYRL